MIATAIVAITALMAAVIASALFQPEPKGRCQLLSSQQVVPEVTTF